MSDDVAPVTADLLRDWRLPEPGSSKDARGTAVVVGGSSSTPGAVILAGESVLRAGGGKLQVATATSTAAQVSLAIPEALVRGFRETDSGDLDEAACDDVLDMASDATVTLLGPGLLSPEHAADLLAGVVPRLTGVVVIDALGSAFVTREPEALRPLAGRVVLTLNHDELAHTLGTDLERVQRDALSASAELVDRTQAVVLCGGPEKCGRHSWRGALPHRGRRAGSRGLRLRRRAGRVGHRVARPRCGAGPGRRVGCLPARRGRRPVGAGARAHWFPGPGAAARGPTPARLAGGLSGEKLLLPRRYAVVRHGYRRACPCSRLRGGEPCQALATSCPDLRSAPP